MRLTAPLLKAMSIRPEAVTVFFNGREVGRLVAFDVAAGTLERYRISPLGHALVVGNDYVREILTGTVDVIGLPDITPAAVPVLPDPPTRHTVETLQQLGVAPQHIEVTLDRRPMDRVMAFDETRGTIERYVVNGDGRLVVTDDRFATVITRGEVAAYLLRRPSDGRWPHGTPKPAMDGLPRVRSILA